MVKLNSALDVMLKFIFHKPNQSNTASDRIDEDLSVVY